MNIFSRIFITALLPLCVNIFDVTHCLWLTYYDYLRSLTILLAAQAYEINKNV